jgi:hypothetical protein
MLDKDKDLVEIFLSPLRKCADYMPAFGQAGSKGLSLSAFQSLYGDDLFYGWLGLDDPIVYSAHKAAGGLTSVYRQLGVGSERLLRKIIRLQFNLSEQQMNWSYDYLKDNNSHGSHTLDARILSSDLMARDREILRRWLENVRQFLDPNGKLISPLSGVVFEVRQGYKSADSKRQNADLRFGMRAYQENLLPSLIILSSQVSETVAQRYRKDGMLVLTGTDNQDPNLSTFAFFQNIVGYDLASFFERNSSVIKSEVRIIIEKLLSPQDR